MKIVEFYFPSVCSDLSKSYLIVFLIITLVIVTEVGFA